jgi:hypothetical protein
MVELMPTNYSSPSPQQHTYLKTTQQYHTSSLIFQPAPSTFKSSSSTYQPFGLRATPTIQQPVKISTDGQYYHSFFYVESLSNHTSIYRVFKIMNFGIKKN